jgi:hypothetical protein
MPARWRLLPLGLGNATLDRKGDTVRAGHSEASSIASNLWAVGSRTKSVTALRAGYQSHTDHRQIVAKIAMLQGVGERKGAKAYFTSMACLSRSKSGQRIILSDALLFR